MIAEVDDRRVRPDEERIARQLVAIRRRAGQTQAQLAVAARVPRRDVQAVESGRAEVVRLGRLEAMFAASGGGARLATWWNGAAVDRLVDEAHAAIVEHAVALMQRRAWTTDVEVSFSEYGERGSIDILACRRDWGAILVGEVKSEIGSLEETNRRLDVKVRLVPKIATERFGWAPRVVGRVLILPERGSLRRLIARHERTMAAAYPAASRDVRAWLRRPDAPIRGLWFLSIARHPSTMTPKGG